MRYRADIDGLRAVAVLGVVLFHAGVGRFSGGFVGVDVFFVISGYLMGRILAGEIAGGWRAVGAFYARRVRRIFPALVVVSVVSGVFATALFLPVNFKDFGQSLLATAVFSSNVLFWWEAGYFDEAAQLKPLLHGWSLAVEEQFYLILPPILWLAVRGLGRGWGAGMVPLALLSLELAVWQTRTAPEAGFYLLPARLWELLLGVMLAAPGLPVIAARLPREALAATGLAAILWAAVSYGATTPFPGLAALVPCLGAAAVIHAGRGAETLAGRLLSLRSVVAVGLISYSLYLWHWPVLVFAQYAAVRELTGAETAAALALSLVLAALSWRFVEQPFRRMTSLPPLRVLGLGATAMLVLAAAGLAVDRTRGWPARLSPQIVAAADPAPLTHSRRDCHFAWQGADPAELCLRGAPGAPASFLLLGDSHADMFGPGLFAAAEQLGVAGIQLTGSSYVPAPGTYRPGMRQSDRAIHALLAETLARNPGIGLILVGQYWVQTQRYVLLRDGTGGPVAPLADLAEGLERLATAHPQRRFVLLQDTPFSMRFGAAAEARRRRFEIAAPPLPLSDYRRQLASYAGLMERLSRLPNVSVAAVAGRLCDAAGCPPSRDGELLYRDEDHLSTNGSLLLAPRFRDLLGDMPAAPGGT